jgi:oxygen-dependent protoporphyrinogen oxidase
LLEAGPNGFLDGQPSTLELCRLLGMEGELQRANSAAGRRFVDLGDVLRELPSSPGRFLGSDLLSLRGRIRVLWERFTPAKRNDADESVRDFGYRRLGREATDVLLDALVTGIHAGDYSLLSLPACFPRIAALEKQFGGLIRGQAALARRRRAANGQGASGSASGPAGTLLAPRLGMGRLADGLATSLGENLLLNRRVTTLAADGDGRWRVKTDEGEEWRADAVVLASPAYAQAKILSSVDAGLANLVEEIPYTTAVVCVLGYRQCDLPRPLDGFGYIAPERMVQFLF